MPAGTGGGSNEVRAGGAFVELFTKDNLLMKGLARAQASVKNFASWSAKTGLGISSGLFGFAGKNIGSGLADVGKLMNRAAVAGLGGSSGVLAGLGKGLFESIDQAGVMQRMADKLGETTDRLSAFAYAAKTTGIEFEELADNFENWPERLSEAAAGSGEAAEAFKKLNLGAADLQRIKELPITEQMIELSGAMEGITNETDRLMLLGKFFSDKGQFMNQLFKQGPAGIRGLMAQAGDVGAVMDPARTRELADAGKALDLAWAAVKNTFMAVGAALLPSREQIARITAVVVDNTKAFRNWISENKEVVQLAGLVAAGVAAGAAAFLALGPAMGALAVPAQLFTGTLAAGLAVIPGAVGVVGTAVVTLGSLIAGTVSVVSGAVGTIVSAVMGGVGLVSTLLASGPIGIAVVAAGAVFAAAGAAAFVLDGGLQAVSKAASSTWGAVTSLGSALATTGRAGMTFATDVWSAVTGSIEGFRAAAVAAFGSVLGTARQTWSAVVEAIKGGDLQGAANVAFAGLKLAWAQMRLSIEPEIDELWEKLEDAWQRAADAAKDVWADVVASMKAAAADIMAVLDKIVKAGIFAVGLAGPIGTVTAIKLREQWDGIDKTTPGASSPEGRRIEAERNAERDRTAAERAARDKAKQEIRDKAATDKFNGLWMGAAEAEDALNAAIEDARRRAMDKGAAGIAALGGAGALAAPSTGGSAQLNLPKIQEDFARSVKGVFDFSNAALSLGIGDKNGSSILNATKKTAANTEAAAKGIEGVADTLIGIRNELRDAGKFT